MNKTAIAVCIIAATAVISAPAQNLYEEVVVEREITPVVRSATRPSLVTPQILAPNFNTIELSIREYLQTAEITRSISQLAPVAWADSLMRSPYRGYASAGYFPAYNVGAAIGYRFVHNQRTDVGAHFSFDGNSWKGESDNKDAGNYRRNQLRFGIDGSHVFKAGSLSASFDYTYSSTTTADDYPFYDRGTQAGNFARFDIKWQSPLSRRFSWMLAANVGYAGFTKNKSENFQKVYWLTDRDIDLVPEKDALYGVAAQLRYKAGNSGAFVLDLGADFRRLNIYHYFYPKSRLYYDAYNTFNTTGSTESSIPDAAPCVTTGESRTQGIVSLRPAYTFNSPSWTGRLGLKVDINTGGLRGGTHIAPEVKIGWHASKKFAAELNATGGEILNTNASLWQRNPWMTGTFAFERSHINADIQLSATIGIYKGFWAKIDGGWSSVSNWLVPVVAEGVNTWYSRKSFSGFNIGLELGYAWSDKLIVTGHARTASHTKYYRWDDNAKYTLDIAAKIRPISKLQIEVGFETRTQRQGFYIVGHSTVANDAEFQFIETPLGNASNLFAGAEYQLFKPLTIFLKAENILGHHHYITTNIRSNGIHGLLGLQLLF